MNALLLSAGAGERLKPLTNDIPKCLLPATTKRTLLEYWLCVLEDIGIDTIYVDSFWQKQKIVEHVNNRKYSCSRIIVIEETDLKPVGRVLRRMSSVLGDRYLICNTDTYIDKDKIHEFIESDTGVYSIHLGVTYEQDTSEGSLVTVNEQNIVTSFTEKPRGNISGYSYAGIMMIDNEAAIVGPSLGTYVELTPNIVSYNVGDISIHDVGEIIDIGRSVDDYYIAIEKIRSRE